MRCPECGVIFPVLLDEEMDDRNCPSCTPYTSFLPIDPEMIEDHVFEDDRDQT